MISKNFLLMKSIFFEHDDTSHQRWKIFSWEEHKKSFDMEKKSRICHICGEEMPIDIYYLHVLRCKRYKTCTYCGDEVPEDMYDLHLQFCNERYEYCPYCGEKILKIMQSIHKINCEKSSKTCIKCGEKISPWDYTHEIFCKGRTKKCHYCGDEVPIEKFDLHQLICKNKVEKTFVTDLTETRDSYDWKLKKALKHDLETFGPSNVIRLYDKSIDYHNSDFTRIPLKLASYTGELIISTSIERFIAKKIGGASLPTFGQSLVENAITGLPSAAIRFVYGEPTDADDELGLAGVAGLVTLIFAGPIAALTVLGSGFLSYAIRKIFKK